MSSCSEASSWLERTTAATAEQQEALCAHEADVAASLSSGQVHLALYAARALDVNERRHVPQVNSLIGLETTAHESCLDVVLNGARKRPDVGILLF